MGRTSENESDDGGNTMAERRMLAIDLGASSGRGIVGSFDGNKLSLRENHRF